MNMVAAARGGLCGLQGSRGRIGRSEFDPYAIGVKRTSCGIAARPLLTHNGQNKEFIKLQQAPAHRHSYGDVSTATCYILRIVSLSGGRTCGSEFHNSFCVLH